MDTFIVRGHIYSKRIHVPAAAVLSGRGGGGSSGAAAAVGAPGRPLGPLGLLQVHDDGRPSQVPSLVCAIA
jgi:hypothetical protein